MKKRCEDLGRRLFIDRLGRCRFIRPDAIRRTDDCFGSTTTSFDGEGKTTPIGPPLLVLCLQSTLLAASGMLGEWAELKAILDEGQPWLSSDKLKAVRLLGKQPFDVHRRKGRGARVPGLVRAQGREGRWYWEISMEMTDMM